MGNERDICVRLFMPKSLVNERMTETGSLVPCGVHSFQVVNMVCSQPLGHAEKVYSVTKSCSVLRDARRHHKNEY